MKLMVKFLTGNEDKTTFLFHSLPLSILESPSLIKFQSRNLSAITSLTIFRSVALQEGSC
jgi:hypothetical protein